MGETHDNCQELSAKMEYIVVSGICQYTTVDLKIIRKLSVVFNLY